MKALDYRAISPQLLTQLSGEGVFLTAGTMDTANSLTIGWGTIGIVWRRPVFVCAIRLDRYTHRVLEQSGAFTVSIPATGTLSEELKFIGTKSGRDMDKYAATGLTLLPGQNVSAPVIAQCPIHLECQVVSSHIMEPGLTHPSVRTIYDTHNTYHVLFYGEILSCYSTEEE
ncbi:flavin reductase family protein [Eubacteriales bacterium OttesenSCG-928-M02]|nr:flavin reductase family protein [Eubacteriales bacterium OttesenSCG-928-M02]